MQEQNTMMDFMDEIEKSMKRLNKDEVLEGTVMSVTEDEVLVNMNTSSDGVIMKEEWSEGYDYQLGDQIWVYVLNPHDGNGNVVLSHKRAEELVGWEELEDAAAQNNTVFIKVTGAVKGGVRASYRHVGCFIPASLLSYRFVEDLTTYTGKVLEVKVEEIDREKKRVVLSRKAIEVAERAEKKEELMSQLQTGEMRQGVVTKLMKFGAFVDLGGAEGLIHLNDLAWHRVNHPSEVVAEGDTVMVYVGEVDQKTGKIGLVLKQVEDDPWNGLAERYQVGDLVTGKVKKLMDFGAFVELQKGVEGLVHISEISSERIRKPADVLKPGDTVEAILLSIDEKGKRISLSIKEAEGQVSEDVEWTSEEDESGGTTLGDLFADKFKNFFPS